MQKQQKEAPKPAKQSGSDKKAKPNNSNNTQQATNVAAKPAAAQASSNTTTTTPSITLSKATRRAIGQSTRATIDNSRSVLTFIGIFYALVGVAAVFWLYCDGLKCIA